MVKKASLNRDTWLEYTRNGFCGLCGNSGKINCSNLRTPAGQPVAPLIDAPCICPNGRAIRYIEQQRDIEWLENLAIKHGE